MSWTKRLLIGGAATLAVVGLGLGFYVQKSLPTLNGELSLPGLSAPVQVLRDTSDVTHVLAQTPDDAWRALGYVHAQERGWQLEFNRRVMRGELAEVLGEAALETDKLMRTLGIRQAAQRQYERLPADARRPLDAYAAGVRAFVESGQQARAPEFVLLGIDPQAQAREGKGWDAIDSVGWSIMMALDLGGNWGHELARLSALQVLDTQGLWQLFPPYEGESPAAKADLAKLYRELGALRPAKVASASAPGAATSGWQASLAADLNGWAADLGHSEGKGSNNWVVDGSRSASGKPLLANDPHLGLSAPAIWYFARLQAPDADGAKGLDVIGATLPGLPFVVLGRTRGVAWGFTNTAPDVQDLYLEQINPANPAQYRVPSASGEMAWADFETRQEVFKVKGKPDVVHTVRHTRHGPVLSDAQPRQAELIDTQRFALALRWTALEPDGGNVVASLAANRATDVDSLRQAFSAFVAPMQNVLMADTQGRIAYKAVGRVPVRRADNDIMGMTPSPGWDARYDWTGYLPYAETPQDDGQKGWIATANQRIHGPDYPHFLTQDWAPPYRQQRIEQLLKATPHHDAASFRAIHGDLYAQATLRLLPFLLKTTSQHALAPVALKTLNGFDGVMRADHAAPLIFTAWIDEFTRGVIGQRIGKERFESLYGKRNFRSAAEGILERDDKTWCGAEGCAAASAAALGRALDKIAQAQGQDVGQWQWGKAHPALSVHRPLSNIKALAPLVEVRTPTGGDPFTVNVGQYHLDKADAPYANRHAASLRAIYDLSNLDNSRFIYQTGQSGHPLSGRYRDMAGEWEDVEYRPLSMNPGKGVSTLTLKP